MILRHSQTTPEGRRVLSALMALVLLSVFLSQETSQAAVFGDGLSPEADYDNRVPLGSPEWSSLRAGDWVLGGGTIHCNGRQRGSAIVLETASFGPDPGGLVLATAAHVLYDLETGKRFETCSFHYLGLSQLPGYRAEINLSTAEVGEFDPHEPKDAARFGHGDWAFLHAPEGVPAATEHVRIGLLDWSGLTSDQRARHGLNILAWSTRHNTMSVATGCRVMPSQAGDLGGGGWPGQLLDDCDSGQGASGGGLVASLGNVGWLIGVRTGTHYDGVTYPLQKYPDGPPIGTPWDARTHTNFARAIDQDTLEAFRRFLRNLDRRNH